jgi:hypothetical protein
MQCPWFHQGGSQGFFNLIAIQLCRLDTVGGIPECLANLARHCDCYAVLA